MVKDHVQKMILLFVLSLLLPSLVSAGTTGKIAGIVTDASTGDPLPGVNILVVGTPLGAMTDLNGDYYILNITPGTYTVRAQMLGYQTVEMKDLVVNVDVTREVNFRLKETVLEIGAEIVVISEKPLIQPDVTAKTATFTAREIESMPIDDVRDILTMSSGIIEMQGYQNKIAGFEARGLDQMHVRGGRNGEIAYMIDGMYVEDAIYAGMGTFINREAISEMNVIVGTFNAEYGQAQASVVNIVTKEGGENYSGMLELSSGEIAGMLGSEPDNLRDAHDAIGSLSGPVPLIKNMNFYLSGEQAFKRYAVYEFDDFTYDTRLVDDVIEAGPSDPTYQELERQIEQNIITEYSSVEAMGGLHAGRHVRVGDVLRHNAYGDWRTAFGARDQTDSDKMGMWDAFDGWRAFGLDKRADLSGKLTYRPSNTTKLTFTERKTDRWFRYFDWSFQFAENGIHIVDDETDQQGLIWTHQISPSTFYEVRGSRFWKHRLYRVHGINGEELEARNDPENGLYNQYPTRQYSQDFYYNLEPVIDPETGQLATNPVGRYVYQGATTQYWTRNYIQRYEVAGNITSQIDQHHQIKSGFEYSDFDIRFDEIQHPYIPNPYIEDYLEHPEEASFYIQDKMEYPFLVVNAGIRVDYANSKGMMWEDPMDPTSTPLTGEKKYQISPRLGFGYPITDKSTFHFSYGHFFQNPEYRNLYVATSRDTAELRRRLFTPRPLYGNPHLEAQKTVSYELGVRQQIGDFWAVDLTLWNRENNGEAGTVPVGGYWPGIGAVSYFPFMNFDYGSAKGIDVTIEKRFSDYYSGVLNYTYSEAKANKYYSWSAYWDDDTEQNRPKTEYKAQYDQPHVLNINAVLRFPEDFGPTVMGIRPLQDFTCNLIVNASSGYPYTPQVGSKELEPNSGRRPFTFTIDTILRKDVTLYNGWKLGLFARAYNLLDRKNPITVFAETGEPDDPGPGASGTSTRYDRPHYYGPRRTIDLGLRLSF